VCNPSAHRTERYLYRIVIYAAHCAIPGVPAIPTAVHLMTILNRNPAVFQHTRFLLVGHHAKNPMTAGLISACAHAEDIYFEGPLSCGETVTTFAGHRLARLTCSFIALHEKLDLAQYYPCYSTLTHLCLRIRLRLVGDLLAWLQCLPQLAHLALHSRRASDINVRHLLELLPRLQCVIIFSQDAHNWPLCDDTRVMYKHSLLLQDSGHDWQHGHITGNDFWWRAHMKMTYGAEPPSLVDWELLENNSLRRFSTLVPMRMRTSPPSPLPPLLVESAHEDDTWR
jgi:hypothetical protein